MQKAVAVFGGNAFAKPGQPLTMGGQMQFALESMRFLHPLLNDDVQLLISHGNGPQVGHMLIRVEAALGQAYSIPLEVCVAESEGELGYVLEQALYNVQLATNHRRPIAAMLTQVVVDPDDPAFNAPAKPIGPFYSKEQAKELKQRGFDVREDAGRGYRRVVPSPAPQEVVEMDVIRTLFNSGVLVIAAGGGGIPVVREHEQLRGVEAVIDKDFTAALMADQLDADLLVILTDVPCASRNFGSPHQEPIGRIGVNAARQLVAAGEFAAGSMRPKMQGAVQFAQKTGRRAIICNPPSLDAALKNNAGTIVECD
ncbi:MAG: carbamate kinase [Planctomycetaceae bacterium]|jgi:carbamate kinase